jgi:hypothetical protein
MRFEKPFTQQEIVDTIDMLMKSEENLRMLCDQLLEARDKTRELMFLVIGIGATGVLGLFLLIAFLQSFDLRNRELFQVFGFIAIFFIFGIFLTQQFFKRQRLIRSSRILSDKIWAAFKQLEELVRLASSIDTHMVDNHVTQMKMELYLASAENERARASDIIHVRYDEIPLKNRR